MAVASWKWLKASDQMELPEFIRRVNDRLGRLSDTMVSVLRDLDGVDSLQSGATTPSIAIAKTLRVSNPAPVTITTFKDGQPGDERVLWSTTANTTIAHSAAVGGIFMLGGANVTMGANEVRRFLTVDGVSWRELQASSALSGLTLVVGDATISAPTSTHLTIVTTNNVAADNSAILWKRGATLKWRTGVNVAGTNLDSFDIYNDAAGARALSFANTTLVSTFGADVQIPLTKKFQFNAGGTSYSIRVDGGGTMILETNAADQVSIGSTGAVVMKSLTVNAGAVNAIIVNNTSPTSGQPVTVATGTTTANCYHQLLNTGGTAYIGLENSAGGSLFTGTTPYSLVVGHGGASQLHLITNNAVRATIDATGTFAIASGGLIQRGTNISRFENTFGGVPTGAAGPAIELGVAAGVGIVQSYNRTTAALVAMSINALSVTIPGLGGGSGLLSVGAANSGGAGFRQVLVPN